MKTTLIKGKPYSFTVLKDYPANNLTSTLKADIEESIFSKGLIFRLATISDIERIAKFQSEIFYPHKATLETDYELFRIIEFGYALLIESKDNEILACYTTVHYGTTQKEGYGLRVGVSKKIGGNNFGAQLSKYATILAYENGCINFRALCRPSNFFSTSNVLNYVGYHCQKFYKNLPSFGARFDILLPLTLDTFKSREIDFNATLSFIKKFEVNTDYLLIKTDDTDRIEEIYETTDFKIIAFLKANLIDENPYFFAVKMA